jgi:phage recombination protein Bet
MSIGPSNQPPRENVPTIAGPRLPYHPALKERFNIDKADWSALVDAIFPTAQTPGAVILALSYCRARRLDPFKKMVHIVPIWDKERRCMVETVWPGIAEHRTTAARTRQYAGHDKIEHGPMMERTWADDKDEVTVCFPEWAQMTVYRIIDGQKCDFPGPQVYWLETYASKKNDAPNTMWRDRPMGMIDKCAEAAALRGAFPEELGDEPTEIEASGRNFHGRPAIDVTPQNVTPGDRSQQVIPKQAAEVYTEAPTPPVAQPEPEDPPFNPPTAQELQDAAQGPQATPDADMTDNLVSDFLAEIDRLDNANEITLLLKRAAKPTSGLTGKALKIIENAGAKRKTELAK